MIREQEMINFGAISYILCMYIATYVKKCERFHKVVAT